MTGIIDQSAHEMRSTLRSSGARSTPQNLQTCPRSVPKMALKKVSREFLNQCGARQEGWKKVGQSIAFGVKFISVIEPK